MTAKILPFFFLLTSCGAYDPPTPHAEIVNNNDKRLRLELHFDSVAFKPHWALHDFRVFLTHGYGFSDPGPETKLVSVDTLRLVQVYAIPSKGTFNFEGWGVNNDSVLYNRIKLINNTDTLDLKDLGQIKLAFKAIDKYTSRFEVK
jgi:hypothetical protein